MAKKPIEVATLKHEAAEQRHVPTAEPKSTVIDPNESPFNEFAAAIGLAFMAWQGVEMTMNRLFVRLLMARMIDGAEAVLSSVNVSTRRQMLDIAARYFFYYRKNPELQKQWSDLSKRLEKMAEKRNRLAHYEIHDAKYVHPRNKSAEISGGFLLSPPHHIRDKFEPGNIEKWRQHFKSKTLTYQKVKMLFDEFNELSGDLDTFMQQLPTESTED